MTQAVAIEQIKNRVFILGSVDTQGYFSISSRPYFHADLKEAQAEADRLAAKDPTKIFVPMQLAGGSKAVSLVRF